MGAAVAPIEELLEQERSEFVDRNHRALTLAERANRRTDRMVAEADAHRVGTIDRLLAEFDQRPQLELLERILDAGVHVSEDRVELVAGRMGRAERRALLRNEVKLVRGRLVPVIKGGVVGMQYASFRNAPAGVQGKDWVIDPATFYQLTARNEQLVAAPAKASGWDVASPLDFPLAKRGILHELQLVLTGTMTITLGGGTSTQGWKWPMGNFGRVALQSSGEAGVQYGTGMDFRTRIERLYRNPPTLTRAGAGAGTSQGLSADHRGTGIGTLTTGVNTIKVVLPIPVAHDLRTGMGSIFRASDDLNLVLHIDQPQLSGDLVVLTGAATAVWTNVNVQLVETYMRVVRDGQGRVVLPDISRVFMTTTGEQIFSANGMISTAVPRLPGVLLAISHCLDQGNGTNIAPAALSQMRFVYGENQAPIRLTPDRILEKNMRDYNDALLGAAYYALDGEVDNPQRDVWIPRNFTEGAIEIDIPTSVTPVAGSRSRLFFESLVQANLE